jgi:hypothetical protein
VKTDGSRLVIYASGSDPDPRLTGAENDLIEGRVTELGFVEAARATPSDSSDGAARAVAWNVPPGRSLDDAVEDVRSIVESVTGLTLSV